MAQFAGGKAKNPNKPRDGWTGASINGHPLKLVGVGCSNSSIRASAPAALRYAATRSTASGHSVVIGAR